MKKVIALLLMAAMLICLCSCGVSTEDKYNNAAADVKAGNYDKAIAAFEALNGYQDSDKYIMYAKCLKAGDSGEYEAAIKSLQTLGDFKEASMYIKYYTALSYEAEQQYEDALDVYEEILLFKDVQERYDENLSAAAAAREAKWQVGNYVTFGTYPQTEAGNDSTPIEWLVLARDGDKALVISRYALDAVPYNTKYTSVKWETCSLRTWLNNDFYNKAFSGEEKRNIVRSKVTAERNPSYGTTSGNDTNDNVFLLSITEVNNYFKDDASRMSAPTDYAVKNGASTDNSYEVDGRASCWWWLRSPGSYSNRAAFGNSYGSVNLYGHMVDNGIDSVRPCVWVRLF